MKCFYDPRDNGDMTTTQDQDGDPGAWHVPDEALGRHGASRLDPDNVVTADGWPEPVSTVYRKSTLLLPGHLHEEPALGAINEVLGRVGMRLVSVPRIAEIESIGTLAGLPRPALLVPASSNGQAVPRAQVDAWTALTALRSAAGSAGAGGQPGLDAEDVGRISLERLLTGAALTGGGPGGEPIVQSHSLPGAVNSIDQSYLYLSGDARTPVALTLDAPLRRSQAACAADYGRRPVVAVLDSGLRAHPWLGVTGTGQGEYATAPDGSAQVDQEIQDIIYAYDKQAVDLGDHHRRLIKDPWDTPETLDGLVGELAPFTGHGTFIAGIFRQVVPDATVLSIRIMHNDGIVYESDLIIALALVAARVAKAQQDKDDALMVDAVSLSLGYFIESPADAVYTSALRQVIDTLLDLGVVVTAAAGNYATSRKFYPAAFAVQSPDPATVPLISVGALNPNGTRAIFSSGGDWVTAWAPGAALVSTFPVDLNGTVQPDIRVPGMSRESLDLDDYRSGFAAWSGTSFSAPMMAADILRTMLEPLHEVAPDPVLRLTAWGAKESAERVRRALGSFRGMD